jgi:hypothetical protein
MDKRERKEVKVSAAFNFDIQEEAVLVLRILHSHSSITKIRKSKAVK